MLLVCFWLAFGEDLVGGLGPGEWVVALVPAVDEGADLGVEVLDGGEDSSADGRTVDDGEEDLDHVEPGGAGGGEVDVDARVGLQPGAHLEGLVGCVVVHHQVQLVVGVGARDLAQEDEQLGTAVTGLAGGCDAAGGDLQGGEQGGGAVPVVVVGAPLDPARLHGQHRGGAVQGLDLGLLVDAQHHGVVRGCQVQAHHFGDLGDQLGIGGVLEGPRPPGLDPIAAPHPRHGGVADAQVTGQQPARPVRDPVPLGRWRQGSGHDPLPRHLPGTPRAGRVLQPPHTPGLVAAPPGDHRGDADPHRLRDPTVSHPLSSQEHDPRPPRQTSRHRRGTQPGLEHLQVTLTQNQSRSRSIRHTPIILNTNHKTTNDTRH